jgi:hypothetical protein
MHPDQREQVWRHRVLGRGQARAQNSNRVMAAYLANDVTQGHRVTSLNEQAVSVDRADVRFSDVYVARSWIPNSRFTHGRSRGGFFRLSP